MVQTKPDSKTTTYLESKQIPQLLESLVSALLFKKPEDPVAFLQQALKDIQTTPGGYNWSSLIGTSGVVSAKEKTAFDTDKSRNTLFQSVETNEMRPKKKAVQVGSDLRVVFVLGGPGSGKGTQCARLAKEFGLSHVSVGDLFRAEVEKQSEIGRSIDGLMKEGKIVPLDITLAVLELALAEIKNPNGVLVDGYPREMIQAIEFEKKIGKAKFALYFECSEAVLEKRLLKRGETSGRSDDNIESIRNRFKTFQNQSKPVAEWYQSQDRLVTVSSEHSVDEVYAMARKPFLEHGFAKQANVVFVLGGPGSGKGTQCERLSKKYKMSHISVGDLLRAEVAKQTEIGKTIDGMMQEGKIVPLETTLKVLESALATIDNPNGVLVDGYPREMVQATEFEKKIGRARFALYFECSEQVLEQRLLKRGETSGRSDDNIEAIKKRFVTFVNQSKPVVDWYETEGRLVKLSSEHTVEEVFVEACKAFDARK